jgi:hypothetical protein
MLIEEPFVPTQVAASEILKGITMDDMPFLLGYVGCQGKDRATIALVSDYGDPVLASWAYGLGRSVAFTSDAKSHWAADWNSWEAYPKFWAQLVRSVMSTGSHKDLRSTTRTEVVDGVATVTIDVRDRTGAYRVDVAPELSILSEGGGDDGALEVRHVAPGLFQATFRGASIRSRSMSWVRSSSSTALCITASCRRSTSVTKRTKTLQLM